MRYQTRLAAVSGLALALAACGGPAEEAEDTTDAVEDVAAMETPAEDADAEETETDAGGVAEEQGEGEPAAAPTAASTPTPAPVAAMEPPAAFTQCAICHSVEPGENGIGPSLAGVAGRRAASVAGFNYTPGMRDSGLTWNDQTLDRYLADPAGVVPGTNMVIAPLDAAQRRAIIAYLKTL